MHIIRCRKRKKEIRLAMLFFIIASVLLPLDRDVLSAVNTPYDIEQSDDTLRYTFYFDEPLLTEVQVNNRTFTEVEMEDCYSSAQPGFPKLPLYRAILLLPHGYSVETVQVTSTPLQMLPCNLLQKPILPEQDFIRIGIDEPHTFFMNDTAYTATTYGAEKWYENSGVGYCRGYAILTVSLAPLVYEPKNGTLSYHPEMIITIQLQKSEEETSLDDSFFLRNSQSDEDIIREFVTNPSILSTYTSSGDVRLGGGILTTQGGMSPIGMNGLPTLDDGYPGGLCDPVQQYQYVIITSQSLRDTNGFPYNWSSLITHRKIYDGLNGTIITVQEIDACQDYWNTTALFNDSAAHIREFCKDAYLDWNTEYILLGGDWDATPAHQIVPYRLFTDREETETYNTMACDKYYSHLDGTWYYEPQGIWGGGRNSGVNDYYAELYVGRIAAYNASMVSNAIQKIIWYDLNASDDWLSRVSFLGGNLGWTVTSKQYMEELRLGNDTYRSFTGFEEWNTLFPGTSFNTSECLYHADIGSTYKTYFSHSIEDDNASIINHLDHSDWTSPFGLTNWQNRYNTKPFFGYSQGCLAGRFHAGNAGSEQLMCASPERNAFALVLNTGYGYASSTSSNGPSQYIQCYFYDYFFNNQSTSVHNWQLGKAQAHAAEKMSARIEISSHAWCYAWYSTHLFADPAQTLKLKDSNKENISFSNETPENESTNVPISTTILQMTLQHALGNLLNYSIYTNPNVGNSSQKNTTGGTITCPIMNLSYSTTYTWFVNVSDGNSWTNRSFWFITEDPDTIPPEISSIRFRISNPIDLQPGFGWENISCNVTDNIDVDNVTLTVRYPNNTTITTLMNQITGSNNYYSNTTFSNPGNYSFFIYANDTNHNEALSTLSVFILPPNWDIDSDRICSIEDLLLESDQFGLQGAFGWIRQDVDNNGRIDIFDLVLLSNNYQIIW